MRHFTPFLDSIPSVIVFSIKVDKRIDLM